MKKKTHLQSRDTCKSPKWAEIKNLPLNPLPTNNTRKRRNIPSKISLFLQKQVFSIKTQRRRFSNPIVNFRLTFRLKKTFPILFKIYSHLQLLYLCLLFHSPIISINNITKLLVLNISRFRFFPSGTRQDPENHSNRTK